MKTYSSVKSHLQLAAGRTSYLFIFWQKTKVSRRHPVQPWLRTLLLYAGLLIFTLTASSDVWIHGACIGLNFCECWENKESPDREFTAQCKVPPDLKKNKNVTDSTRYTYKSLEKKCVDYILLQLLRQRGLFSAVAPTMKTRDGPKITRPPNQSGDNAQEGPIQNQCSSHTATCNFPF